MQAQNPQPSRFQVFNQLPNGLGFTIKDCNHVFYYDKYRGWKDEYGNYYNADGQPEEQPLSESQKSISENEWSGDEDQYEREFGPNQQVLEQFQIEEEIRIAITKNMEELERYPKNEPLRVNFEILDNDTEEPYPSVKQLILSYQKKVKGVINAFYDVEDDPDCNTGYFVVKNVKSAQKLVELEGENVVGSDVNFEVELLEDFNADSVSEKQKESQLPKFVDVDKDHKIVVLSLENGAGFSCKKQEFQKWIKQYSPKYSIIKMLKLENQKQKKPVIKLPETDLDKLQSGEFEGKKVVTEIYKPKPKPEVQEKTEQKVIDSPAEETQPIQPSQTQQTKQASQALQTQQTKAQEKVEQAN